MTKQNSADRNDEPMAASDMRLSLDADAEPGGRIKVIGVGGGGSNAVEQMVGDGIQGVEFIVANTDAQALARSTAPVRLQIGAKLTRGLGAGADPNIGRQAALEDTGELITALDGADMVFVTAGLGGGTGTGAAPVIANLAAELGALTVAVVTKPFAFEGRQRTVQALGGLEEIRKCVDTVITIPNERILSMIDRKTSLTQAFAKVDEVLRQAIYGISDLVLVPGLINLDFADVATIMSRMGLAIMGTGVGRGDTRAVDAAANAISSPLLENVSMEGARGVLVNVTGGEDLSMMEVSEAASIIQQAADADANIIFGAVIDPEMQGDIKITVIATGFQSGAERAGRVAGPPRTPVDLEAYTGWSRPVAVADAGAEPAPEPAAEAALEPDGEPALEAVPEPEPAPAVDMAPEFASEAFSEPAPEPAAEAPSEPVSEPAAAMALESDGEPAFEMTPEPAPASAQAADMPPESAFEAPSEPVADRAVEPAAEPFAAPAPAPAAESASGLTLELAPEPAAELAAEPVTEAAPAPAAEPVLERHPEQVAELVDGVLREEAPAAAGADEAQFDVDIAHDADTPHEVDEPLIRARG